MFGKNISGWRFQTIRKYYCSDGVVSCQEGMQNKTVLKPLAKRPPLLPHVAVFLFQFTVLTHVKSPSAAIAAVYRTIFQTSPSHGGGSVSSN